MNYSSNQTRTIPQQLVEIYYKHEPWHKTRMLYPDALWYHKSRYENGNIYVYEENEEVLGYYERYFVEDKCFLYNVWIKEGNRKGYVFKSLYRQFFKTMPPNIKYIVGEKVKLGGKMQKVIISKERKHGIN